MKLNLSPPKNPEDDRLKKVILCLTLLGVLCTGMVTGMVQYSTYTLQEVKDEYDLLYSKVESIKNIVHRTDRLWRGCEDLFTNLELYNTIRNHNERGVELIEQIGKYIPSFLRVTSIQIYPNDSTSCQIQISGVLKTYQEYADLMTSLMQMPKVKKAFRLPVLLKPSNIQTKKESLEIGLESFIDPVEKMASQIALAQPSIVHPLTGHKIGTPFPPLIQEGSVISVILVVADTPYKVPNTRFTLSGVVDQTTKKEKKH